MTGKRVGFGICDRLVSAGRSRLGKVCQINHVKIHRAMTTTQWRKYGVRVNVSGRPWTIQTGQGIRGFGFVFLFTSFPFFNVLCSY